MNKHILSRLYLILLASFIMCIMLHAIAKADECVYSAPLLDYGMSESSGFIPSRSISVSSGAHLAVDYYDNHEGANVYPIYDGFVADVNYNSGAGNYVLIRHTAPDGSTFYSQYQHLNEVYVTNNGQPVTKGVTKLGAEGKTGNDVLGVHVHLIVFSITQGSNLNQWPLAGEVYDSNPGIDQIINKPYRGPYLNVYIPRYGGNYMRFYNPSWLINGWYIIGATKPQTLEFTNISYPSKYNISDNGWNLDTGLVASDAGLVSIQSIIIRKSDNVEINNTGEITINNDSEYFPLASIDSRVKFSDIKASGQYIWKLIAKDMAGRSLSVEMQIEAGTDSTSVEKLSRKSYNDPTDPILVSEITLNQTTLSLNPGGTFSLTATVSSDNATNKALNWTTSDSSVATVSASGLVTAVGVGTATITVTAIDGSEKYATCSLSVNQLDNQYTNASSKIRIITQHKNDFQNLIMPGHPTLTVYEGGCGLFSIAHAIQWLSNSSLSDSNAYSLMEKLVSLKFDTAPNDESNVGGTSRGMTACLIALTNFDSSLVYHQGVMTSSYVSEEHIKSIFDQGGVIISNPAGHYVLAVGYRYYNNQLYIQIVDSSIHSTIYPGNTVSNLHRGYIFDSMQEIATYQGDIGTQYWLPWNCFAGKCSHNRVFQDWWWVSGTTSISKYINNYTSPEKPEGVEIVCYESPMLDEVHQYRLEDHAEVPLMGGSFPNEVEVAWESSDPSVATAPSSDSIYMKIVGPGTAVIKCYCVDYPDVFAKFTVEVTSDNKPSIEFIDDGGVPTGNLPKGQSYELKGIISSDAPIIEVMATVYDLYTNEPVAGEIISLWGQNPIFCYPNSNTFDIYYSDINRVLKFGNLPDGAYKYELKAATSPENIVLLVDSNFTIGTGTIPVSEPDFILPAALTEIEEEAFAGISTSVVKVQENVKTIGSRAFANCSKLKAIYIPEGCEYIAADAFSGVVGLTIYGQEGSYAEYYANRYNFTFEKVKE